MVRARSQRPEFERHYLAVEQAQDAAQRAYPADAVAAPAHRLRPWKPRENGAEQRDQNVRCRLAGALVAGDVHAPLPIVTLLERVVAHAERSDEAIESRLRRTDARAAPLDHDVSLPRGNPLHLQRKAPRRRIGVDPLVAQLRLAQRSAHQLGEIGCRPLLHPCGNLFREEFEQELGHGR